jgi:hypothetical protein
LRFQTLRHLQRRLAFAMPLGIAVFGLATAGTAGFPREHLVVIGIQLFFGVPLAISLHKRSQNRETAYFSVRVLPDSPAAQEEPVNPMSPDFLFVVGAVILMLMALLLPYLK